MVDHPNQFALLGTRRFWPLFVTQAIGAFNDNAFRYALSILLIYDLGPRLGSMPPSSTPFPRVS